MRVCIYEDSAVRLLDPVALTRPAFDLRCGAFTLLERQCRHFEAGEVGALVRPLLSELCQAAHPSMAVNDPASLRDAQVLANARWLPPAGLAADLEAPHVGLVGDQIAYVALPPGSSSEPLNELLERCRQTLPHRDAGGAMIDYPWDLVERNGETLGQDLAWCRGEWGGPTPDHVAVVGPRGRLVVSPEAVIEPMVVVDTTRGPVFIEAGAAIQAFSRLEGPCHVGRESQVLGAKLRGSTVGPNCRVGGEVECSILHGHSNKYHDGFLGHSYVGEWVNLGAGCQVSDLRNDYGPIGVTLAGKKLPTGLNKVGAYFGDHTKVGLNTLINSGTVVGAFSHLLPTGQLLPKVIQSFCEVWHGQLRGRTDLREVLATAATVVQRRGQPWGPMQTDFVISFYEQTALQRRQFLIESEQKRLRRIG